MSARFTGQLSRPADVNTPPTKAVRGDLVATSQGFIDAIYDVSKVADDKDIKAIWAGLLISLSMFETREQKQQAFETCFEELVRLKEASNDSN